MFSNSQEAIVKLYDSVLNLALDQANVDLLVKIWSDSTKLNTESMLVIKEKIVSFLPYLQKRLGLPQKETTFKEFVEDYDTSKYNKCQGSPDKCLVFFAKRGDLRNVKRAFKEGAWYVQLGIEAAAKYNHREVIDYILKESSSNGEELLTYGLAGAIEGNHTELSKFFLEKNVKVSDKVLTAAAKNGRPEVLNFFEYNTIKRKKYGLVGAARGGHLELVKKFLSEIPIGDISLDEVLEQGAASGNLDLVKYIISLGVTDLDDALVESIRKNHFNIFKYILDLDRILSTALLYSSVYGNLEITKYLVEEEGVQVKFDVVSRGMVDVEIFHYLLNKYLASRTVNREVILLRLLTRAVQRQFERSREAIEYIFQLLPPCHFVDKRGTVLDIALRAAVKKGNLDMLKYLLEMEGRTVSIETLLLESEDRQVTKFLSSLITV